MEQSAKAEQLRREVGEAERNKDHGRARDLMRDLARIERAASTTPATQIRPIARRR